MVELVSSPDLPSFVKDTKPLLQKIEELNKSGPFPQDSLLVSWDVVISGSLGWSFAPTAAWSGPSSALRLAKVNLDIPGDNGRFHA